MPCPTGRNRWYLLIMADKFRDWCIDARGLCGSFRAKDIGNAARRLTQLL